MPPTWPTLGRHFEAAEIGTTETDAEVGRGGLEESVTFLPEWRPIPAQEIGRRRVRCAFISECLPSAGCLSPSKQGARVRRF